MKQTLWFAIACVIGMACGGHLAAHIFFGILTLMSIIALVENITWIKWIVYKTSAFVDVLFFGFSIVALASIGPTIAAALTVASLGFTLAYRPYLKRKLGKQLASKREREYNDRQHKLRGY